VMEGMKDKAEMLKEEYMRVLVALEVEIKAGDRQ